MLSPNVTANLDHLASLGILDYDAAAHIAGTAPRYIGSPTHYVSPTVMTPLDYTNFSYNPGCRAYPGYNPFYNYGQYNGLFGIPWKTVFGTAGILGGLYICGKLFLAGITGIQNFSVKGFFKNSKKALKRSLEDAELAARRGGRKINKGRKKLATKLGLRKPWYQKAGNAISDAWKWAGKNIKKIKIR